MFVRYTSASGVQSNVFTDGHGDKAMTALRYLVDAHKHEPVFVVRGRDLLAVPTIIQYGKMVEVLVASGQMQDTVLDHVRKDAQIVGDWQAKNGRLLKYADRA